MANPRPHFQLIQGGTGGASGEAYIDTGVVDDSGRPMLRKVQPGQSTGGSGGDGSADLASRVGALESTVSTLGKQVGWIFASGLIALIALFFIMDQRLETRFDKADEQADEIARDVGALKTDSARNFERILLKLENDQSETGSRGGQAGRVRR